MKTQTLLIASMLPALTLAAAKHKVEASVNMGYGVEFYECDKNLEKLTWESRHVKSQGSIYRICIIPNEKARADGVGIKSIDSFIWHMTKVEAPGFVESQAVKNGKSDNMINVLTEEKPGQLFVLDSMLPVSFYINAGAVEGSGVATMEVGSGDVDFGDHMFKSDIKVDMSNIQMLMEDMEKNGGDAKKIQEQIEAAMSVDQGEL